MSDEFGEDPLRQRRLAEAGGNRKQDTASDCPDGADGPSEDGVSAPPEPAHDDGSDGVQGHLRDKGLEDREPPPRSRQSNGE